MHEFRMPSLGSDMEEGTLVEWLVGPGDEVARGDIIAVVETEKGAIEIEVFDTGILDRTLVDVGATLPVGAPMALIREPGEAPGAEPAAEKPPAPPLEQAPATTKATPKATPKAAPKAAPAPPPAAPPSARRQPKAPTTARAGVRASPAARALAAERGIDLADVTGSGPEGAVLLADVEAAPAGRAKGAPDTAAGLAAAKAAPPEKESRERRGLDLGEMRKVIAAAMARSKREIPHYYLATKVDMTAALDWLSQTNADRPPTERLLAAVLYLKATARALGKYPEFNGFNRGEGFEPAEKVHAGMAVAIRGGGLVAPAIHDTADRSLDDLMAHLRDLTTRVRTGRLRSSELSDPTITVTSLGERGVEEVYGVIYPPQVAIVGFGKPVERPWVNAGHIEPRSIMTLTLSADHRVSDGHRGALFLNEIATLLQDPDGL